MDLTSHDGPCLPANLENYALNRPVGIAQMDIHHKRPP